MITSPGGKVGARWGAMQISNTSRVSRCLHPGVQARLPGNGQCMFTCTRGPPSLTPGRIQPIMPCPAVDMKYR